MLQASWFFEDAGPGGGGDAGDVASTLERGERPLDALTLLANPQYKMLGHRAGSHGSESSSDSSMQSFVYVVVDQACQPARL